MPVACTTEQPHSNTVVVGNLTQFRPYHYYYYHHYHYNYCCYHSYHCQASNACLQQIATQSARYRPDTKQIRQQHCRDIRSESAVDWRPARPQGQISEAECTVITTIQRLPPAATICALLWRLGSWLLAVAQLYPRARRSITQLYCTAASRKPMHVCAGGGPSTSIYYVLNTFNQSREPID